MKRCVLCILIVVLMGLISGFIAIAGWQDYQSAEIVIEWSTASELNTVGYNLYRSLSKDQIGEKITPTLIPVGGDLLAGNDYSYIDQNVQTGKHYYYWLEDIDRQGNANRNGPIEIEARQNIGGLMLMVLSVVLFALLLFVILWQRRISDKQSGENAGRKPW